MCVCIERILHKWSFHLKFMKRAFILPYEMTILPYEMTTSARFCLSFDRFKWDFIALKVYIISIENVTLSWTAS